MSKSNLLYDIQQCKSQDELMALWKTLSATEQQAYKDFFSKQKARLQA